MKKNSINNIKLGIFIIAGLFILVVSLYLIGKNQHFFGSNFVLKARFRNVEGLMPGNNVRFSGIQCGTVKDIEIVNDTTIEVTLLIDQKTNPYIHSDAMASIGTEGLMGNKVINISAGATNAPAMPDGGILRTSAGMGIDAMLSSLGTTGDNAAAISVNLRETSERLNNSSLVRELLADTIIADDLRRILHNFHDASIDIKVAATGIKQMIDETQKGEGTLGVLLKDRQAATEVAQAINHINSAAARSDALIAELEIIVSAVSADLDSGQGAVRLLLKDSLATKRLQNSLENIEQGTKAFNEDMEALKHNFLLRGYFRKQERKKGK